MIFKKLSKQGFTMIEALIIAGLLGVLIATFASYQYQRMKQNKAREARVQINQFQTNLKNSINQSESLTQSEDQEYAKLPTPTPTASATPTATPETPPHFCPNGCHYVASRYACEVDDPDCYSSNTCPEGCMIAGIPTSTTTATSTTGSTSTPSTPTPAFTLTPTPTATVAFTPTPSAPTPTATPRLCPLPYEPQPWNGNCCGPAPCAVKSYYDAHPSACHCI